MSVTLLVSQLAMSLLNVLASRNIPVHGGDIGYIPLGYVTIECTGISEHTAHVSDVRWSYLRT